jgi:hypothetical protein
MLSNADFLPRSLSNIHLGSYALVLLNKRTCRACRQPHGIRTNFVLRVDLVSNLNLVSNVSPLSSLNYLPYQQIANSLRPKKNDVLGFKICQKE